MHIDEYEALINKYITHQMSADDFCRNFENCFLTDTDPWEPNDREFFNILEDLFESQLVYSPLWDSSEIDEFHITEEMLYSDAQKAILKIIEYRKKYFKT